MSWHLVPLAGVAPSPWRNGGGSTRELLAWPAAADWQVRISVADVERDGPFSRFDGIERWFAVLRGRGVTLRIGGDSQTLDAGSEPLRFYGGAPVQCGLVDGPTRDFNLMAPPGRARLRRLRGRQQLACAAGSLVGLYAHGESVRVVVDGEAATTVPAATLAWRQLDAPAHLLLDAPETLWMEVVP